MFEISYYNGFSDFFEGTARIPDCGERQAERFMKTIRTTCALDCQDACGIDADVEDGRIVRLRGAVDHPYTEGFLCIRLNRFLDRLYGP